LLLRINRELGANFDLDQFSHLAFYDSVNQRVDIRLVSRCNQMVELGPQTIHFSTGEAIRTEYSHKYTVDQFNQLADEAGLTLHSYWTDDRQYFAVLYFQSQRTTAIASRPRAYH
jgi:uncharacterized SAM-dependent methyltransferase